MTKKTSIIKIAAAGAAAGVVSGFVKLGWEALLPPRTPERDATNPPQATLEKMGMSKEQSHATYTYSNHEIPWMSLVVHFTFSSTFGAMYAVAGHYVPLFKLGRGVFWGLGVWAGAHLLGMPAMGVVPSAKEQPAEEHISEAAGHAVWNWVNDAVTDELLNRKE